MPSKSGARRQRPKDVKHPLRAMSVSDGPTRKGGHAIGGLSKNHPDPHSPDVVYACAEGFQARSVYVSVPAYVPFRCAWCLVSDELGCDVLLEEAELVGFVVDRPDVDPLYACGSECAEFLGEHVRRSDAQTVSEDLLGTIDGGDDPFGENPFSFGFIVGDVEPHGRQPIREVGRVAFGVFEMLSQFGP